MGVRALAALLLLAGCCALRAAADDHGGELSLEHCRPLELDFIVLEGEATLRAIEDDIAEDLAKIGVTVVPRFLPRDEFNEAMVGGDFNMAFSESWGAPYDPQAFASSWNTPDEAYFSALAGLPEPNTQAALAAMIDAALLTETEEGREAAWTEILQAMHEQATEVPISGKRIPAVISRRLSGYQSGHQQVRRRARAPPTPPAAADAP